MSERDLAKYPGLVRRDGGVWYPEVSLSDARLAREMARKQLEGGIAPSEIRKSDKRAAKIVAEDPFQAVADEWFNSQSAKWLGASTSRAKGGRRLPHLALRERFDG